MKRQSFPDIKNAEEIVVAKFDCINEHQFILLGYRRGFQIWEIDLESENAFEKVSIRDDMGSVLSLDVNL